MGSSVNVEGARFEYVAAVIASLGSALASVILLVAATSQQHQKLQTHIFLLLKIQKCLISHLSAKFSSASLFLICRRRHSSRVRSPIEGCQCLFVRTFKDQHSRGQVPQPTSMSVGRT